MSNVISIQARLGSTRLPGKVLLPIGDNSVLEWTVRQSEQVELTDNVLVAVGDDDLNRGITTWCDTAAIPYVVGPEENLLERHLLAVEEMDADTLIRVTADSPFVPPAEIDRLVREYMETDVDCVTNYTDQMPVGTIIDVVDRTALEALAERGETHPLARLYDHPDQYDIRFSNNPRWTALSTAHLEVNTADEYRAICEAFDAVGPDPLRMGEWLVNNQ